MLGRKSNKKENKNDSSVKTAEVSVSNAKSEKTSKKKKFLTARFFSVIGEMHFTEKASNAIQNNKYIFKVAGNSNKIEIKKAIEGIYNVDVKEVNVINSKSKVRRYGATIGKKKSFKKAIVTLADGQNIDFTKK